MVASSAQTSQQPTSTSDDNNQASRYRLLITQLLAGMAVLGFLFTAYVYLGDPATQGAESANARRKAELVGMRDALERYANDHNGKYPTTNGQYWCANCTYKDYFAKGVNNWIPELVAQGYATGLPRDISTNHGTACHPMVDDSYAGYVYYSPAPPNNNNYKLFAFCTPPLSALNTGRNQSDVPYCSVSASHNSTHFNPRPAGQPELKPFVDPVRPTYAYAIYTPGLACL